MRDHSQEHPGEIYDVDAVAGAVHLDEFQFYAVQLENQPLCVDLVNHTHTVTVLFVDKLSDYPIILFVLGHIGLNICFHNRNLIHENNTFIIINDLVVIFFA